MIVKLLQNWYRQYLEHRTNQTEFHLNEEKQIYSAICFSASLVGDEEISRYLDKMRRKISNLTKRKKSLTTKLQLLETA